MRIYSPDPHQGCQMAKFLPRFAKSGQKKFCLAVKKIVWPKNKNWPKSGQKKFCLAEKKNLAVIWANFDLYSCGIFFWAWIWPNSGQNLFLKVRIFAKFKKKKKKIRTFFSKIFGLGICLRIAYLWKIWPFLGYEKFGRKLGKIEDKFGRKFWKKSGNPADIFHVSLALSRKLNKIK